MLSISARRARGAMIGKTKHLRNMVLKPYNTLVETGVYLFYFMGWTCGLAQIYANPYNKRWPGLNNTRHRRWTRLWNTLLNMPQSRLTHKVLQWDYSLANEHVKWTSRLHTILSNMVQLSDHNNYVTWKSQQEVIWWRWQESAGTSEI